MLALAALASAGALALFAYALLGRAEERAAVRASLRQLETYEVVETMREQELLQPFGERVLAPLRAGLASLGRRFTPAGYVATVRRKLTLAGRAAPEELDRFLAVRVVTIALVPVWFVLAFFVLPLTGRLPLLLFGLLTLFSVLGPDAILNRRVAERQHQIRVKLPDILDLLVISIEAGLGFEQALDRTVAAVPGPLSAEFTRVLNETRAGSSRAEALRALDERTDVAEVRSFVLAILQADTFGVSIGRVLRTLADEMRIKRRQLAQEQAQKAPVKMLIPMVFCIFPALFVVVIGPAVINIYEQFVK
ncbi:MAG: type II secretion system protein [Acidimicrobiia bacterium]